MRIGFDRRWVAPLCLVVACVLLFACLHLLQGSSPLTPTAYNTYTLQAMQWRKGTIALDHDVPHLELAIYQDRYWVSFPPVPTVPVFLLTFLFGDRVPDTLLIQFYAVLACLTVFRMLGRMSGRRGWSAVWAFLFLFGSSFLPLLQNGAVWYQAQALALLFTVLAIERMQAGYPTQSLICFALSVGCRPFNALYGPVLILMHLKNPSPERAGILTSLRSLLPGILAGLAIAAVYAAYNMVRFGKPLEFGHSYLPEFSFQGGTQFSIDHIARNAQTFLLGGPFEATADGIALRQFGFSLLLANPVFICFILWVVYDAFAHTGSIQGFVCLGMAVLHLMLLLSHRTMGGFQYGARYAVDAMPWALLYVWARKPTARHLNPPLPAVSFPLLSAGLLLAAYGAVVIHLPF